MADGRQNARYYDADQAAKRLGCARGRVHAMIRSGTLRLVSVGGKALIPAGDVDGLLDASSAVRPSPAEPSRSSGDPGADRQEAERQQAEPNPRASGGYYYTPSQAAEMLSTSLADVDKLVRSGGLTAVSVNKYRWIKAESLEDAVRRRHGSGKLAHAPEPTPSREIGRLEPREVRAEAVRVEAGRTDGPPQQLAEAASRRGSEEHYTVEEVSEKLGKPQGEVWRMVFFKKLRTETVNGQRLFPRRPVDDLVAEKRARGGGRDAPATSQARGQAPDRVPAGEPSARDTGGFYSAEEVAVRLGADTDEVWEMVYRNRLPIERVGGQRMFPKEAVENMLDGRGASPRPGEEEATTGNDPPGAARSSPVREDDKGIAEEDAAEHRDRLMDAAKRYGTQIKVIQQMDRNGTLVVDPETDRLMHRDEVSARTTDGSGGRGTRYSPPEMKATEAEDNIEQRWPDTAERESGREVWMLQDELRAERERNERLEEELRQEREVRDQEEARTRYEVDYLEAEIENLRRELAAPDEALREDLEEERRARIESEGVADGLRDELHEEIEQRREAERALEGRLPEENPAQSSSSGEVTPGRTGSWLKEFVETLTGSSEEEGEDGRDEVEELQSRVSELEGKLKQEESARQEAEKRSDGSRSRLERDEVRIGELEDALSVEREERRALENEKRLLDEVRRMLGAQPGRIAKARPPVGGKEETVPTEAEPAGKPAPESITRPEIAGSGSLVLDTPYGPYTFDPPFALGDREEELLRFVAREDDITAEQIRRRKGRRAPETLNDLLDRLTDEGANPIVETNDRYGFDRSLMQGN